MRWWLVSLILCSSVGAYAQQKIPPTQISSLNTCSTALQFNGTIFQCFGSAVGTVTSIGTTPPILGGTITHTGTISCQTADTSHAGCLPSADWNTFNGKQAALSTSGSVSHQFITAFTAPNTFSRAQPACGDLSDFGTGCSTAALASNAGAAHKFFSAFTAPNTLTLTQPAFADITGYWSGSDTLDFGNLVAIGCEDLTIAVAASKQGDPVILGVPNASIVANSSYSAWVSADGTVSVRFCALISGDPASGTFKVSGINQ